MIPLLPYRRRRIVPPPEPPLGMIALLFPPAREPERDTGRDDALPDPYGPDPVVFGSAPRAGL